MLMKSSTISVITFITLSRFGIRVIR